MKVRLDGFMGWLKMIFRDGWKCTLSDKLAQSTLSDPVLLSADFILAACDVEGNFLVVKAYQYTTLLSCMLLDAWAIPVCLLFSWLYMRPKYHWTQLLVCGASMF